MSSENHSGLAAAIERLEDLVVTGLTSEVPDQGNTPYVIVPDGHRVESLEKFVYNDHASNPERVRANVTVLDPESFIEYYSLFSDVNSRIFASEPDLKVLGVLDYHASGDGNLPRWCQHRVSLCLRSSEEWKIWTGKNNQAMTQEQFAQFLEQYSLDITSPQPAHMRDVARDLQARTEVEFARSERLADGQVQLKFVEQTKATVGNSQTAVPEQFAVSIPVFVGGPKIPMQAFLRFRARDGKLSFWYTLVRPEEVQRQAFLVARNQIAEKLSAKIINGKPE